MSDPLVTAFIPSYNKARFVEAALESVSRQAFRDFEFIIIDDCSTDGSRDVIASWIERSGLNCRFIEHRVNRGVCKTCNEVVALAKGKYLAGLGADDRWHPEFLRRMVEVMEGLPNDTAILYCDAERIDEDGRRQPLTELETHLGPLPRPHGKVFHSLLAVNYIPALAALTRLDCIRALGGYDEGLFVEDWDMHLRLAEKYDIAFLPERLAQYRILSDSMSRSPESRTEMLQARRQTLLKWVGYDRRADELIDRTLGDLPAALYQARHPAARHYVARRLRRRGRLRDLVMLACLVAKVPYPGFQALDRLAVRLKAAGRTMLAPVQCREEPR